MTEWEWLLPSSWSAQLGWVGMELAWRMLPSG
jgi:hypothetical protein